MVDLYARLEYNKPLEELAKVIRWITSGHLQPDYGFHGRFLRPTSMVFEAQDNKLISQGDRNPAFCLVNLRQVTVHDTQETCEHQPDDEYVTEDSGGQHYVECEVTDLQLAEPESEEEREQEEDEEVFKFESEAAAHALEEDDLPISTLRIGKPKSMAA